MKRKIFEKLLLEEDELDIEVPAEVTEEEPEIEELPSMEIVKNAFTDSVNGLITDGFKSISDATALISTMENEKVEFDKEAVKTIISKFVDETTINIGLLTKALELIDGKQTSLMNDGIAQAEDLIAEEPDEVVSEEEKPVKEDLSGKRFIKTVNSSVDTMDLAGELDARGIPYELGNDGLFVPESEAQIVEDILLELESEELDESWDKNLIQIIVNNEQASDFCDLLEIENIECEYLNESRLIIDEADLDEINRLAEINGFDIDIA